ncbi:HNH/ENDO VII family nuclease [Solibacillus sp. FSL R7-0682]|uniref:HNH/ENDO VII family nuclease n=1 Tax=Solibacillus sp. FSL R7-0682 TaxID=2921690 RepID=UPI0030F5D084
MAVAYTSFKEGGYKGVISAGLDFIPIVGNAKALVEAAIGRDPITGRKLESWERGASAAAILGGPLVKGVKLGAKLGAKAISGATSSSKKTVNLAKSPTPTNPTKQQAPSQAKKEASATTATPAKSKGQGTGKTNPVWLSDKYKVVYYEGNVKVKGQTRDVSRRIYQNNEINWDYFDPSTGLTNRQRAKLGNAPIGSDGYPIELHHTIQKEVGPVVELQYTKHKQYYFTLHVLTEDGNSFRNNEILDKQYKNFRGKYWRWRANNLD